MHTYVIPESPVGTLTLAADDDDRLCRLEFGEWSPRARAAEIVRVAEADGVIVETLRELHEYFAGTRHEFDVQLAPHGTQFQLAVWDALRAIPYGETTSYGVIARSVGRPNAVRAVGQANGRNPIAIIVPCHRVIGSDRSLIGYGGGIERKRYLLGLENSSTLTPALDL
jgi:methylated-DNA-[protein]-cysteine S-methyltransferase